MLLPDSAPVCAPAESIAGVLRKEGLDVGSASVLILRGGLSLRWDMIWVRLRGLVPWSARCLSSGRFGGSMGLVLEVR